MKCPNCGNETQVDAIFCDRCGMRLDGHSAAASAPETPAATQGARGIVCPDCGASNTPGEMFCSECGAPLAAPQPDSTIPAEPARVAAQQAPGGKPTACPACGGAVGADDAFCYACGAELGPVPVTAQPPATAPPPESPLQKVAAARAAQPAAKPPGAAPSVTECPACGAQVTSGDAFCEFCGAAMLAPEGASMIEGAPEAPPFAGPSVVPGPEAMPSRPRLIVASTGIEISLPPGSSTLVGREDPVGGVFPDVDMTPHGGEEGGVSRRHFRITLAGGQYAIEDLNSTNFTLLNRQRLQAGVSTTLADGDEIRAGRVRLIFRVG